jgi:ubiquinone/menaquinone biosynthesis C-methylase UbiE
MSDTISSRYVMGHSDRERRRLALQGTILNPITEQLLRRAGLAAGLHVLDFGCGVGDVSLIAARLVGPGGRVTGLDVDEQALAIARERAREEELHHADFVSMNLAEIRAEMQVDAVVGRHILIHTPDPASLVRAAFGVLKPGGVAVFQEFDFSVLHRGYPRSPLGDGIAELFNAFFSKAAHVSIGTQLYHLAVEAGFRPVECRAEYPICGGPDSGCYEWIAESLRSILPRAEALGLVRAPELDIDTLAGRLREEAVANNRGVPSPVMVGCIARKP